MAQGTLGCLPRDQTGPDRSICLPQACSYSRHAHPIARDRKSVLSCQPVNKTKLLGRGRSSKQDCHARVIDYCGRCAGEIRKLTTKLMAWQEAWLYSAEVMFLLLI